MSAQQVLRPVQEIEFGPYGGAELFFADLNQDGLLEILAYQGPAVFGARLYAHLPHVGSALPRSTSLSAFDHLGNRLWTWGEPNPPDVPYLSHAFESCVAAGDVDSDGTIEVALADGRRVHLLDGATGKERASATLPWDNFYIVQVLGDSTRETEAALVVKNGEGGLDGWGYGQPLLALNAQLKPVWGPKGFPGAGHHILALDLDSDGRREYLVGYCAVKPDGQLAWKMDCFADDEPHPDRDHVDYTDIWRLPSGEMLLAFAGSSRAYLGLAGGRTLWSHPDQHVQGCALGRFRGDGQVYAAFYNDDGPLVLYNQAGEELWRRPTPNLWPMGMPHACEGRVFHRNRPIVAFSRGEREWILFSDGGWPWGMDGEGEITLHFDPPANSAQPDRELPPRGRADDFGYGYATRVMDWDGDGQAEVLIYDRRYLWVFR